MDIKDTIKENITQLLDKLGMEYSAIEISEGDEEKNHYSINIQSDNPSHLIGHHGDNIQALQHVLKVLCWRDCQQDKFNILVDIDNYKKRQEENIIEIAQKKVQIARKTGRPQKLPPMSPYYRRKIHMHCMSSGFEDIETLSEGEDDKRHVIIKLKN